jgi:hypothetical protein
MANAARKVREHLRENPLQTLVQIKSALIDLKSSEISMALCYLNRKGYLTRELIANENIGRKQVWKYQFKEKTQ